MHFLWFKVKGLSVSVWGEGLVGVQFFFVLFCFLGLASNMDMIHRLYWLL